MKRYGQFCPVAKGAEVFAERWTPLIVRELMTGSRRFSEMERGMPLISRTLLSQRLQELERFGLIERRPLPTGRGFEYRPTPACEELYPVVVALGSWAARWFPSDYVGQDLNAGLIMQAIQRCMRTERMPFSRLVVQCEFTDATKAGDRRWWLILEPEGADLCLKDPGFGVDVLIVSDMATMARLHMGKVTFEDAAETGLLRLEGTRQAARAFVQCMDTSTFAGIEPAVRA